jgi:hypothetical protein
MTDHLANPGLVASPIADRLVERGRREMSLMGFFHDVPYQSQQSHPMVNRFHGTAQAHRASKNCVRNENGRAGTPGSRPPFFS